MKVSDSFKVYIKTMLLIPHKLLVRAECVRQRNEVAIILGIIFSSSLSLSLSAICSEQTWSLIG